MNRIRDRLRTDRSMSFASMCCISCTGPSFFLARALFELGLEEEGVLAGDHLAGAKAVQNLGCLAGALAQLDGAHPKAPWRADEHHVSSAHRLHRLRRDRHPFALEIGRASCRERVCPYV